MEDEQGQYNANGSGVDNSDSDYEPTDNPPFVADSGAPPTDSRISTPLNPSIQPSAPSTLPKSDRKAVSTGFLVEQDDEDDVSLEPTLPMGDGVNAASNALGSLPRSASQTPSASMPHVSIQNAGQDKVSRSPPESALHSSFDTSSDGVQPHNSSTAMTSQTLPLQQGKASSSAHVQAVPKTRLPHDIVGILEDRIKEDPRGDMDAWLSLINEHRRRNKFEDVRKVYERFFKVFPSAAEQWVAYAHMELQNNEFFHLEQIFNNTLLSVPNVQLWSLYLDYIRRRNNLTTDADGSARRIINSAYEFALQKVGIDKDAANIWQDYVQFIRSGPGVVGGTSWQDQQKVDTLRKTYQRAICVPTQAVNTLWKEYDTFEMGLNKMTGRKFLQEKSPSYMTARSSFTELQTITRDLVRTTLPKLPPTPGFDGEAEYAKQVEIWNRWIEWEKSDPLVLKDEDVKAYHERILYVYQQCLMALRYWPAMWFEATEFCFQNGLDKEGTDFLIQGTSANPESCLLAFKYGDRLESTTTNEGGLDGIKSRAAAVRAPYDKLLDALYDLIAKAKAREAQEIARIEANFAESDQNPPAIKGEDDDDDDAYSGGRHNEAEKNAQIESLKTANAAQIQLLSKTISFAWIALMRASRRIGGKGSVGDEPGSRQIFADARKRGRLTSDVYVASALIEYHCYKDLAATKIFERGMKLFPEDESFALGFLRHLIASNDITNARAVFETTVSKLTSKPENVPKAKPIFAFLHEYESHYGELTQVIKLEKRMGDLFPEDPMLKLFSHRYTSQTFNPTAIRPIISPLQSKPKVAVPSVENPLSVPNSPGPRYMEATSSPKRPFVPEDFDDDSLRPRKLARGESPLKGAAGRRLDQQRRLQQANGGTPGQMTPQSMVPPLPREVMMLLSVIPNAKYYNVERFSPEKMVDLLRNTDIAAAAPGTRFPPPNIAQGVGSMNYPGGQQGGRFEPHMYPPQTSNPPMAYPPNPYPQTSYPQNYAQGQFGPAQSQGGSTSWNFR